MKIWIRPISATNDTPAPAGYVAAEELALAPRGRAYVRSGEQWILLDDGEIHGQTRLYTMVDWIVNERLWVEPPAEAAA